MINHNTSIRTHTFNSQEEVIGGSKDGFCSNTSIAHGIDYYKSYGCFFIVSASNQIPLFIFS